MKEERVHRQGSTTTGDALDHSVPLAQDQRFLCRQPPMPVGAWNHVEWTVLGTTIVQVGTHGDQRFQHVYGRLDVQDALFCRPAGALGVVDALLDRNAQVLVQPDEPVPVTGLVKEGALDCHRAGWEQRRDVGVGPECRRKLPAPPQIEQIARADPARARGVDGAGHISTLDRRERAVNLLESTILERRHSRCSGPAVRPSG
jgi:hypothetical protein